MNTRFPTERERQKRTTLLELLEGGLVMIHLDTRCEGVDVPDHLRGNLALALNLSHAFRLDVFELGPYAVTASLSFGEERYRCTVPWGAIFAMTRHADDERRVFVEDIPHELAVELAKRVGDLDKQEDAVEPEGAGSQVSETSADEAPKPTGSHLRLLDTP